MQELERILLAHCYSLYRDSSADQRHEIKEMAYNLDPFRSVIAGLIPDENVRKRVADLLEKRTTLLQALTGDASSSKPRDPPQTTIVYQKGDIVVVEVSGEGLEYAEVLEHVSGEGYLVSWLEPTCSLDDKLFVDVTTGTRVHFGVEDVVLTSSLQDGVITYDTVVRAASVDKDRLVLDVRYVYDLGLIPAEPGDTSPQRLALIRDELVSRIPPELTTILRGDVTEGYWKTSLYLLSQLRGGDGVNSVVVDTLPDFHEGEPVLGECVWCRLPRTLHFFHAEWGGMGPICYPRYVAYAKLRRAVGEVRAKNLLLCDKDKDDFEKILEHAKKVAAKESTTKTCKTYKTKYKRLRLCSEDESDDE